MELIQGASFVILKLRYPLFVNGPEIYEDTSLDIVVALLGADHAVQT